MRRRALLASAAALAVVLALIIVPALADTGHSRPSCTGQLNEVGFGSRDAYDHKHIMQDPDSGVAHSLYELEGWLNVCRTSDTGVAESVSASARTVRSTGTLRVAIRARVQRWTGSRFTIVADSGAANTFTARTLTVTSPTLNEVGSSPAFTPGWYRVLVTSVARYTSGVLLPASLTVYTVWLGDGPAVPPTPPGESA
jgi:hypothetical protein